MLNKIGKTAFTNNSLPICFEFKLKSCWRVGISTWFMPRVVDIAKEEMEKRIRYMLGVLNI